MEQDPTLPNQTADPQKSLVTKLINHYEPNVDVTDDYYKSISEKYQDVDTLVTKLINHYEPDSEVTTDYLDGLYGKYGVKKKSRQNRLSKLQLRTLLYKVLEVFRKNLHHLPQLVRAYLGM